ncbi:hypothetical protein [Leptospira stimsonii]|uniref:AraC family transcriptional regulator n=1 Tax=Leptospira stimsonii TaxID=2202203 RepID=A0ABY2N9S5_9LEPT|nr:hypothetical protein [Leptospira stimsonii]TGK11109.1 hypothetical protein EHO98_21440 [Leptospira stimsonii]TGM19095.1 hypothetical protein EHQ90_04105 [Leptospira stimsonii]
MKENQNSSYFNLPFLVGFLFFILIGSTYSQEKIGDPRDLKENKKISSEKELIESGKLESVRKKAFLGLKGIRTSLLNFGKKQDLDKMSLDYGNAETSYLRAEYATAAAGFENVYKALVPLEEILRRDYETKTIQLGQELAPLIVSIRLDQKNKNKNILPILEKYYVRSGETTKASVTELEKGERTSALHFQKQALISLYHIKILLGKNEDSSISLSDRISKNRILETDYLKPEELIYWDDSEDKLHSESEEERKKDRVRTLRSYEWKLGISDGKLQKESESKNATPASEKQNNRKP